MINSFGHFVCLLWYRRSTRLNPRRWCGTNCCPSRDGELWWLALGWRHYTTYQGERADMFCRGCSQINHDRCMKILFCFGLQAQSFKHVPWGIQTQLAPQRGLLIWRQDDRRLICECHLAPFSSQIAFLTHCSFFHSLCIPESNGARGRRWRGGERNKARSPPSAHSAFQSYCSNRKEVGYVLADAATLKCINVV